MWKTDGTWLEAASSGDRVFSEEFISTSHTEVLRRGRNLPANPTLLAVLLTAETFNSTPVGVIATEVMIFCGAPFRV